MLELESQEMAEETLRLLGNARDEIRDVQRRRQVVLSVAALHTLEVTFYPTLHASLAGWFDGLSTKVRALDFTHCMEALAEGACDLFLSYGHADVPVLLDPDEYPHLVLGHDIFVPVCVPGPGGEPRFPWPGMADHRVNIMSFAPNCYLGKIQDRFVKRCQSAAFFDVTYENSMSEAVKAMILAGNGMGWLPRSLVSSALNDGRLVQAADDDWSTGLEIRLYRHQRAARPLVEQVWGAFAARDVA